MRDAEMFRGVCEKCGKPKMHWDLMWCPDCRAKASDEIISEEIKKNTQPTNTSRSGKK